MEKPSAREIDVKRKPLKFGNSENAKVLRQHVKNNEQKKARHNTINDRRGLHAKDTENVAAPVSVVKAFTVGAKPQALGTNTNLVNVQAVSKPRTKEELLAKLKIYKEQKRLIEAQRRVEKKPAFVVPAHTVVKPEKEHRPIQTRATAVKEVNENKRITRSQTQKAKVVAAAPIKTAHEVPSRTKAQPKPVKAVKPTKIPIPVKSEPRKSFAPLDFQFKAPLALQNYSHLFNTVNEAKLSSAIENLSFASPKPAPSKEVPQISPQIYNHPNITRTRGSSSKRKQAKAAAERLLEAEKTQLSSPHVKPAESPSTARQTDRARSPLRKLVFSPSPQVHTPVADEETVVVQDDTEMVTSDPQISDSDKERVKFFRDLLLSEGARLTQCCVHWTQLLNTADPQPPENVCDAIRCVVGQAQLLQKERFAQFAGLVDNCEFNSGEKPVLASDLEGFWDMVNFQVMDVDKKFADLEKLQANNWQEEEMVVVKKVTKKPAKKPTLVVRPAVAKSSLREIMMAKRRELAAAKSPKASPRSSATPSRTSARRSALLNSAKKAEQDATDHEQLSQTPRSNRRRSSRKISLTPKIHEETVEATDAPSPRKVKKTPKRKSVAKAVEGELPSAANDVIFSTGAKLDTVEDSEERETATEEDGSDNGSVQAEQPFSVPTIHIDAPSAVPVAEIPIPEVHHTYSRKHPDVDLKSPEKLRDALFDSLLESRPAAVLSPKYFLDSDSSFDDEPELQEMDMDVGPDDGAFGADDSADKLDTSVGDVACKPRRSTRFSAARNFASRLSCIPEVERASVSSPGYPSPAADSSQRRRTPRRPSLLYNPESPSALVAKSHKAVSPDEDLMKF